LLSIFFLQDPENLSFPFRDKSFRNMCSQVHDWIEPPSTYFFNMTNDVHMVGKLRLPPVPCHIVHLISGNLFILPLQIDVSEWEWFYIDMHWFSSNLYDNKNNLATNLNSLTIRIDLLSHRLTHACHKNIILNCQKLKTTQMSIIQ
jgi:hypothetical protein